MWWLTSVIRLSKNNHGDTAQAMSKKNIFRENWLKRKTHTQNDQSSNVRPTHIEVQIKAVCTYLHFYFLTVYCWCWNQTLFFFVLFFLLFFLPFLTFQYELNISKELQNFSTRLGLLRLSAFRLNQASLVCQQPFKTTIPLSGKFICPYVYMCRYVCMFLSPISAHIHTIYWFYFLENLV